MKKILAVLGCLTVALALGGFTNSNTTTIELLGANGTVTFIGASSDFSQNSGEITAMQDNVKVGDIIQVDGVDEVVFAVAANGSYITEPANK